MKKIFASILALAAFASCSTAVDNDFVAAGTTFTAPMEISVAESRAFDADLNWSWETTDVIAAYQNAGEKSVNALALNASGNFYNEAFTYATEELSQFHFVYPASQLGADYSLTVAQTGAWTPLLYGTVEAATVANLGTVEMNYLSSAFEVRVWEAGRAARKNIVKAVLSSANDFVPTWNVNNDLTYTQTLSGKELSLELNGDTAIFNLGEGDFAFNLVLTDTEGETLTYELPAKNFVAGKRTILNVEWFEGSAAINSWYEDYANNGNSALEGGAIYVTAEGGDAVVTVNGAEKAVVDGKISGLASGTYNVVVTIKGHEVVNRSIVVTSIPTVSATIRTSYSNNGSEAKNNSIDGKALQVTTSLSDSELASYVSTCQVAYGSTFANCTLNGQSNFTVPVGAYNCYVKVALKNGYVCQSQAYTTHVTGIPLSYAFYNNGATDLTAAKNAGWSFSKDNLMSDQLALFNNSEAIVVGSPKFHAPANINTTTTLGHRLYKAGFTSSTYNAYVGASSSPTSAVKTNTYPIKSTNSTSETASINTHKGNDTNVVVSSSTPYITVTADTESSIVVFYHYLHTIKIEYR